VQRYTPSNLARTLKLIVGYLHLTVAVTWFGAIFYIHIVVRPQQLRTGIPRTESIIGWTSIGIMGVTGTGLAVFRYLETGPVFSGTFGTVFIIKLAQVGLMVLLALIATVVLTGRLRKGLGDEGSPVAAAGEITPETLPCLDGGDGQQAVVAVHGQLYDVTDSRLWQDGVHLRQHHEGRRARHGAAMMEPDYVQWHGFFEVADRFYNAFVPEAEALLPGVTEPLLEADHHQWRMAPRRRQRTRANPYTFARIPGQSKAGLVASVLSAPTSRPLLRMSEFLNKSHSPT